MIGRKKSKPKLERQNSQEYDMLEKKADQDIGRHLQEEQAKLNGKPIDKGIIWIENIQDVKKTHLNGIASKIDSIQMSDSNKNFTEFSWINKDENKSYKIYFIDNANRVNKYVRDFGLPCHLVINVIYSGDECDIIKKLINQPKLKNSHFGIILPSTSESESKDESKDENVNVSEITETFESAFKEKHKNGRDCKKSYCIYSMKDDCNKFWKELLSQCDSIVI